MDLTTILIIFAVVLVISLILRIFFAITKVLIIIAIILAIGAGVFYWFNYRIMPLNKSSVKIENIFSL